MATVGFTGTPSGTLLTYVEWTIKNAATDASTVTIQTTTTGTGLSDLLIWANTLPANAWLKINSGANTWDNYTSTDSGATWTLNNSNVTGEPPRLQGGVVNTVTITGCDTGITLSMTYKPRTG
jgi:hypothetical protein